MLKRPSDKHVATHTYKQDELVLTSAIKIYASANVLHKSFEGGDKFQSIMLDKI